LTSKSRKNGIWLIVYGAAQEDEKEDFLRDLGEICREQDLPMLVVGDFNLLRDSTDKNTTLRPSRWNDMFNYIINTCELRELDMAGGQYTWSNNHSTPTLEKLDRFLVSKEWELLFPLTTVHKLAREVSDHNPLILDTMENREQRSREFRFEKRWLKEEDFLLRVDKVWAKAVTGRDSLSKF
jgi:endonuclease/exonuclease/phosphatase family metal-dependent hydrolase